MGLPSKKRTNRSKRERASHFALKAVTIQRDADGNAHLPHRATKAGSYKGRSVATKSAKRAARALRKTA